MVTFTVRGMHYVIMSHRQKDTSVCMQEYVFGCLSVFLTASALAVSWFHLDWPIHLRDKQAGIQMVNINKPLLDIFVF